MQSILKHWKLIVGALLVGLQLYLFLYITPKAGEDSYLSYFRNVGWQEYSPTCSSAVEQFIRDHSLKLTGKPNASHMIYFLHIPRTAGRTYHSCFLKSAHSPSRRCARSYDVLRLNESLSGCGILGSHDDYSVTDFLPSDAAVITQIRDPVDRILSAYEFAVEVAARGAFGRRPIVYEEHKVSTLAVWPWSYLVPWMENDMRERRQRRRSGFAGIASWMGRYKRALYKQLGFHSHFDPYNNDIAMPLQEFLSDPIVTELLHNGAALQVLGATNYSHWEGAADLRACIRKPGPSAEAVKKAALERLRSFTHVGLQEALDASIVTLAAELGLRLDAPAWKNNVNLKKDKEDSIARLRAIHNTLPGLEKLLETEIEESWKNLERKVERLRRERKELEQLLGPKGDSWNETYGDERHLTGRTLGDEFRECSAAARQINSKRRRKSLSRIFRDRPGFSREARQRIPAHVISKIRAKNELDIALHEEARSLLFASLENLREQGLLQQLPPEVEPGPGTGDGEPRSAYAHRRHSQKHVAEEAEVPHHGSTKELH